MPRETKEKKENTTPKKLGRPRGKGRCINSEKRALLVEGASMGLTAERLALYADVPKSTMYDLFKEEPDFYDHIKTLQHRPRMIAEQNIIHSIQDGNVDTTRWYLERRAKEDYSTKAVIDTTVRPDIPLSDKREAVAEFMRGLLGE